MLVNNCMGKPSRTIIAVKHFDPTTSGYTEEHILAMAGTWAVIYDGQLISIRRIPSSGASTFKYIKLFYPDRGRAMAMARQLNEEYNTTKFQVVKLENVMQYIRPEHILDLDNEFGNNKNFRRGKGRPKGGTNKPRRESLMLRRIVAVEEQPPQNLDDILG